MSRWLLLSVAVHLLAAVAVTMMARFSQTVRLSTAVDLVDVGGKKKQTTGNAAKPLADALPVTEKTSPGEAVAENINSSDGSGLSAASGSYRDVYLTQVRARIESLKNYPASARSMGYRGKVEVAFEIMANGTITNVRIQSPSQYESLNQAAVQTVQNANPLPAIPAEVGERSLTVIVPLSFELN